MSEIPFNRVPTNDERKAMWDEIEFAFHGGAYPRVAAYLSALAEVYYTPSGDDVLHNVYRIPNHPILDWYLSHNQFFELGIFQRLWDCPSVASTFPAIRRDMNLNSSDLFQWESPFLLSGRFAAALGAGGCYSSGWCQGDGREEKRLADDASEELIGSDMKHCHFFVAGRNWCNFFCDVMCDNTWILMNLSQRLIHVILATDTD